MLWLRQTTVQPSTIRIKIFDTPIHFSCHAFIKGHIIHISNYHANHSLQMLINSKQRIISCVVTEC